MSSCYPDGQIGSRKLNGACGGEGFRELGWARPIDLGHDITSYLLHMPQDMMRDKLLSTL
jgi:hypothetical protein